MYMYLHNTTKLDTVKLNVQKLIMNVRKQTNNQQTLQQLVSNYSEKLSPLNKHGPIEGAVHEKDYN